MSNEHNESYSASYAAAGVDVTAGYKQVELIKPMVKSTFRDGVLGGIGGFGGMFELSQFSHMKRPVTVSGTDGVGTKLQIAALMDKHDTIGIDCVAMCVNDIICAGAEPLFFLDYMAVGKNVPERTAEIVSGVAEGCRQAGCALVGGETAEHPGMMAAEDYDVAGFTVGIVDYDDMLRPENVKAGDILIALPSTGLHSNGFSLVRKVFATNAENVREFIPELGKTLGEELLTPTRIYVKTILTALRAHGAAIHGISNITGGGIFENAPRCLPDDVRMTVDATKFPKNPIFDLLQQRGNIPTRDMYNTFNMGVGMILAVDAASADAVLATLRECDDDAVIVGSCVAGAKGVDVEW